MSATPTIRFDREESVARLVLDNPARKNAMTVAMWESLPGLLARCVEDRRVRVVVVEGAGADFCAGADITEFGENRADTAGATRYEALVRAANEALFGCAKPTVAVVRGVCYGGGVGLALACDLRLARADARFSIPAARLGLGYSASNVELVAARIGVDATADLLFSARVLDAQRALADGLVREVYDTDVFDAEAKVRIGTIAANAPLTIAAVKAALVETRRSPETRDRDRVAALVQACMTSDDYVEGREAFAQRRPPVFRGT